MGVCFAKTRPDKNWLYFLWDRPWLFSAINAHFRIVLTVKKKRRNRRTRGRVRVGRKPSSRELRERIFRMVSENPTWGAPRIHGELKMLGFDISERTVLRWMRKAPRDPEPARRWAAFLINHREAIAAMDFFTVPTLTFGVLYCFFVIHHDRRRILHCNVTRHPTTAWVAQQLREAFPYNSAPKYLIFDREHTFQGEVLEAVDGLGVRPVRTAIRSPRQNGVAERWVGACRRDLLDHVIVLNKRHLKRLMNEYVRYYHDDRTHLGLGKETPAGRKAASGSPGNLCQCEWDRTTVCDPAHSKCLRWGRILPRNEWRRGSSALAAGGQHIWVFYSMGRGTTIRGG